MANQSATTTGIEPSGHKPRPMFAPGRVFVYTVLVLTALYYLIPLYVMIITSVKDLDAIRDGNIFIPTMHPTFEPWIKAWSQACTGLKCTGLAPGFFNSVTITIPSVIVSIAVASLTGYSLANWPFKSCEFFFTVLLVGSFIPYQVFLYPLVIITREMGIYSTLYAVIFVHTVFGLPILTVAVILQVTGIWNDFLFGVIYAGPTNYPMTVQLNNIVNSLQGVKEYNVDMAATILTGLVPLTIYFLSGKYFVRGIAAGAIKG